MPKEKGGLDLRGMTIPHHEDASGANAPSPDEGGASRADAYYCNSRGRFSEGGTDEGNRSWVSSRPQPLRGLVDGLLVRGHVHGVSLQHGPVPTIDCRATNSEAVGLIVAQLASAMAWGGEVIKRLTQTQREANDIRRHFDEMAEHCTRWEGGGGGSSGAAASLVKVAKKRKASIPAEKEARPSRANAGYYHSRGIFPEGGARKETGLGRVPALNLFEDSLVVTPSGAVATEFLCNMVLDQDIGRLQGATNSEAAMAWGGEVIKRLTQTQREANDIRRHFDEMAEHCTQLKVRLAELEEIAVDYRQSGPRPDPRLLRQAALEVLTISARTDSPRRTGRKKFSGDERQRRRRRRVGGGGGGGVFEERKGRLVLGLGL
ncbi:hypothetical protein F511_19193 [Dorcoceras hygrometricum]|uniref:Uncharacterized protein n=1 Tax=Dorcoceras hygrometricum TaxID=472368 RepID=A0A2Z7ABM1_9LAMI|nr:hypothetical protein F511_19193 [Dorcoceras hygrometricum]